MGRWQTTRIQGKNKDSKYETMEESDKDRGDKWLPGQKIHWEAVRNNMEDRDKKLMQRLSNGWEDERGMEGQGRMVEKIMRGWTIMQINREEGT